MKYISCMLISALLIGCPEEANTDYCEKAFVCKEEREMVCDKNDTGCGQDCHYYVVEHCWEDCLPDSGIGE
jgi:hypothetical protein